MWQNMKKAECVQKNIVTADVTVPQMTEVLDLAGNVITSLSSNQFHVSYIYISIEQIFINS